MLALPTLYNAMGQIILTFDTIKQWLILTKSIYSRKLYTFPIRHNEKNYKEKATI